MAEGRQSSYHHGDLRAALLTSGLEVLERSGPSEMSLRRLAAAAGVSRAAPYAHFRDKLDLLTAISDTGFERLAEAMTEVDRAADSRSRFLQTGRGYIAFALDNPNLFRLMFGAELAPGPGEQPKRRAFDLFRESLDDFLRDHARGIANSVVLQTMAWSLVHGLAMLMLDDRLAISDEQRQPLVEEVTARFVQQLEASCR